MRKFAAFLVLILTGNMAMAEAPTEKAKIDYLLSQLSSPGITFVRNGQEHPGSWARQHLAEKLKAANNPDMTAEDFITTIASTSSQSGKPYQIKTGDGTTVEAGKWLRDKLAAMPQ